MRIFKKIAILLLALALVLPILASCHRGQGNNEFIKPMGFDENESYEITFWAKNENNANQRAVYDNAIAEFEKLYPNIKVTIKHYTDYGDIYNDVITNITTGTTPNVCITYPDHIATYMKGDNVVVPLDSLAFDRYYGFGGEKLKYDSPEREEMVDKFLNECYIGDELYALPFMRSTEACYVNKTYVEALGFEMPEILTWDFIWEVSEAAMKKNPNGNYKINGQSVMKPVIYKSTDNMMIQMLAQLDGGYSGENGEVQIFNETTESILYKIAEQTKKGVFTTFKIDSYPGNYLNKGQCIFAIDSTAGATWMGADAPLMDVHQSQIADFETAVYPAPQFNADKVEMISQGPSLCIFNKEDPGEVMASWIFAQYLLTNEVQIAYSQTEGYAPVTVKAQNSDEYLDYLSRSGENNDLYYDVKIDATKMLIDNVDNTFVTPVFDGSTSLRNAAGQMIENVTKDSRRKKTVNKEYIEKLYTEVTSLYKLDEIVPTDAERTLPELEEIPTFSKVVFIVLGVVWIVIIGGFVYSYVVKNRKKRRLKAEINTAFKG